MWRNTRGFTLLELMVVLVIISIAMTVVVPRFAGTIGGVELKKQARQLMSMMKRARSQSLAQGVEVKILQADDESGYQILPGTDTVTLPDGYRLQITTEALEDQPRIDTSGTIYFYPDASSSGGKATILSDGHTISVFVDWLTGKVSLEQPESSDGK